MASTTPILGGKVGRARRRLSQLWQVPVFLFGTLALISVAASAPWRHPPQWWEFDALLESLRRGVEQDGPGDQLVALAEDVQLRVARFSDRDAEAHFLIGSAYYRQAKQKPAVYAEELWPKVVEHLEKSHDSLGSTPDRLPLKYRLGYALYQMKKDVPRAIELMTLAADKGAEHPLEAHRLLLRANLELKPANLEYALAASQRVLDLTPEREPEATALARIQHAELLLQKRAPSDAYKELERISAKAPESLRVKAKLLQTRACEEEGQWRESAKLWQELLKDAAHVEGGRARVCYAMGWCYHHMEPPNHGETIRVWSEALKLGGHEGQAAGLRLGELRLSLGNKNAAEALADWKAALAKVETAQDYKNPYIPLSEVSDLFKHAIQQIQLLQDPEKMQQIAELYRKFTPGGVAEKLCAQSAEELAEQWLDKHKTDPEKIKIQDVRGQFRRAAEAHELAARTASEEERPDSLWRSAQCYLNAKEYGPAIKVLSEHIKLEKNEIRLAEGWYTLGDIYRTQSEKALAHDAFVKCIEIPETKFAARARFFLALEQIEERKYDKAYDILKQNLNDNNPSFDRPAHERSLYKMAWLVQQMKKHDEALIYLKECQRLYPENPNVLLARDQLGDCYRHLAHREHSHERDLLDQLRDPNLSEERIQGLKEKSRAHRQERVRLLASAIKTFEEMAHDLDAQAMQKPLSALEKELLRRSRFGVGECHFENEEYGQALRIFGDLQAKNRKTLESLVACDRICRMVLAMSAQDLPKQQIEDARNAAKESLTILMDDVKTMPENHEIFSRPGVPSRDGWQRWHDDMVKRLTTPPRTNKLPFP